MNAEELYQLEAETNVNTSTKQDDESRTKWVVQTARGTLWGSSCGDAGVAGEANGQLCFVPL
jgi:hypothetical protein